MFNILLLWFLQGEYFGKHSHAPTISKVFAYIVVYILHLVFNYVYLFLINELIFVSGKSFETVFFKKVYTVLEIQGMRNHILYHVIVEVI